MKEGLRALSNCLNSEESRVQAPLQPSSPSIPPPACDFVPACVALQVVQVIFLDTAIFSMDKGISIPVYYASPCGLN